MMFGKPKEAIKLNGELVDKFTKVLRKKPGELTKAEEIFLDIHEEDGSPEFYEAVDIVLKEVGIE